MPLYVDLHITQTVPPSNLNRDDTGSPKSATFGGVRRARVSSQAWKRATRRDYAQHLDLGDLGVRTKRAVELLVERIQQKDPGLDETAAREAAKTVLMAAGIKLEPLPKPKKEAAAPEGSARFERTAYLIFWSNRQLDRLADLATSEEKISKKAAKEAADMEHGVDVALFGRMVADGPDLNVDASVQVAHALSTHAVAPEQDYYTAVDDHSGEDESGAGMIGTVEYNSSTLYRYATINVAGLLKNLAGDQETTVRAIEAFVRSFALSMPTGKQNSFANRTVPDAVVIAVREDQPVNLVGAFETPVQTANDDPRAGLSEPQGYVGPSAQGLADQFRQVGSMVRPPVAVFVSRSTDKASAVDELGEVGSFDETVSRTAALIQERLGDA